MSDYSDLITEAMERAENDLGYVNSLPAWERESAENKYIAEGVSLLAHLADALEALQAEQEWEYSRTNKFGHACEYPDDSLEDARRRAATYPTGYTGGYQTVVRRRKASEWEPVPDQDEGEAR